MGDGASQAEPNPSPPKIGFSHLSNWIAVVANVGVLVGLVLVILQLNQNERMIRAQTRHEMASGIASLLLDTASSEYLSDVMYRGHGGLPLSPSETYAYETRLNAILRYWEDVHYQYRMGLYDEGEFDKQRMAWRASLDSSARFAGYWCRVRRFYSAEFAAEMDGLLRPDACKKASDATAR